MKRHFRQLPKRGLIVACHIVAHVRGKKTKSKRKLIKRKSRGNKNCEFCRERHLFIIDRDVHVM